jgi:hypothetical protein
MKVLQFAARAAHSDLFLCGNPTRCDGNLCVYTSASYDENLALLSALYSHKDSQNPVVNATGLSVSLSVEECPSIWRTIQIWSVSRKYNIMLGSALCGVQVLMHCQSRFTPRVIVFAIYDKERQLRARSKEPTSLVEILTYFSHFFVTLFSICAKIWFTL